jgi:MoaA/NifB/PqqE/SkfB family radical SAM enzyme
MTFTDFQKIITKLPKSICWITLYFQGEPLLDETIIEKIKYLRANNYFVEISTNAQNINKEMAKALVESGLNRIIISMDGISQKTYEKYRINGKINNVFEAINNLLESKKKSNKKNPKIIIQYIVFKHNESEIKQFKKMMEKKDVTIRIKNAQLEDDAIDYLPNNKKYRRYKISNDKLKLKKSTPKPCYRLWKEIILLQNGQIAICCHDKNSELINETWHNKTIKQIWSSQEFNALRQRTLISDDIEICKNCDI